jgi:hypothetical protein
MTKALNVKSPKEAWSDNKPSVAHLKGVGCEAHVQSSYRGNAQRSMQRIVFSWVITKKLRLLIVQADLVIEN